ncbi:MAG: membrane-bound lytic murein transglycosylase MltF, partial [Gammaproteobacteria bacterium]
MISCDPEKVFLTNTETKLEQIKRKGVLHVLTRLDPTTYYEGADGFTGLEFDLVNLFADHLGVKVHFEVPQTFEQILSRIEAGKADLAAAGLTVTELRKKSMYFSPAYHEITEQIIYRSGSPRPENIDQLSAGILEVVKGTSHLDTLTRLKLTYPNLEWNVNDELQTDGLLYLVKRGLIDYTVADSNQIALIRRYFPKLKVAFDISEPRQLAWALPKSGDDSLYQETIRFFNKIKKNNTLAQLIDRHYGHASNLSYLGNCKFREHQKNRLPKYLQHFVKAGKTHKIDWRLLAAIGYQESHWREDAKSPTGVRGIMMLTKGTAKQMGIINREDPAQSIAGGTRYFLLRHKKIPKRIPEPDRTWLALASYNIGFGHLEDARILTQKQGGNPDKWMDVKQRLPLLSDKKWYKKTKHGYARGSEPVRFVENIRNYYDLLVWLTEDNPIEKNAMQFKPSQPE